MIDASSGSTMIGSDHHRCRHMLVVHLCSTPVAADHVIVAVTTTSLASSRPPCCYPCGCDTDYVVVSMTVL